MEYHEIICEMRVVISKLCLQACSYWFGLNGIYYLYVVQMAYIIMYCKHGEVCNWTTNYTVVQTVPASHVG